MSSASQRIRPGNGTLLRVLTLSTVLWITLGAPPAWAAGGGADADGPRDVPAHARSDGSRSARASWLWPVGGPRNVVRPYDAPAHRYGPGHRGIDVTASAAVVAPAAGTVAFVGAVADRPLITIAHPDGLVSTLEPVSSPLVAGAVVRAGDVLGAVSAGGHAAAGTVHFGVRLNGEYVNPLLLYPSGRRAILLPCC